MGRIEKTVFISYRRASDAYAMLIYQHLTHHGFDVFLDYTGISSGNFESAILENVRARAHFIVVLTPTTLERCHEPDDWLRREIEEAIHWHRNIVPLFFQGFSFGTPSNASKLIGKLSALKGYNGLDVPMTFFEPAMERLREKYLNVALNAVHHKASSIAQKAAEEQQAVVASVPRIDDTLLTPRSSRLSKQMINDQSRVKHLVPFKYKWAWEKYLSACSNHWMPFQIAMDSDVARWKNANALNNEERRLVKGTLGFFVVAESMVAENVALGIYRQITVPECRQFLLRLAFDETIHTFAYQYIVESLGLDTSELFDAYCEVGSTRAKNELLTPLDSLTNPAFQTGAPSADQALLKGLIVLACLNKGLFFDVAATQIFWLARQGKMINSAELFQYILRDMSMHRNFLIDVINTIKLENQSLWTSEFREEIRELFERGAHVAYRYAEETMPSGPKGETTALSKEYIRFVANERAKQIGLAPIFDDPANPFPWMSEIMNLVPR